MQLMFVVAAVITIFFAGIFCGSIAVGLTMFFIRPLRIAAPFIIFVPSFVSMGAVFGSWGLGYASACYYPMSVLPIGAWLFGLFAGGFAGVIFGIFLAILSRKLFRSASTHSK
jgi:hypothetical protein